MFDLFLQKARHVNNVTQKELAEKTKITQGTISKIENGELIPRLDDAYVICSAFGYNLSDFSYFERGVRDE